jgi:hypothetical protein
VTTDDIAHIRVTNRISIARNRIRPAHLQVYTGLDLSTMIWHRPFDTGVTQNIYSFDTNMPSGEPTSMPSGEPTSMPSGEPTSQPTMTECLPGTYRRASVSDGTITTTTTVECEKCSDGYYSLTINAHECLKAIRGTYVVNNTIQLCPVGTYGFEECAWSNTSCHACPIGFFNPMMGRNFCHQCPSGSYANTTGNTYCIPCPKGTFSFRGSSECHLCNPGSYSLGGWSQCEPCMINTYCDHMGCEKCTPCQNGYDALAMGSSKCQSCDFGNDL